MHGKHPDTLQVESNLLQFLSRLSSTLTGLKSLLRCQKGEERKSIFNSAIHILCCISQSAQAWITQFYLQKNTMPEGNSSVFTNTYSSPPFIGMGFINDCLLQPMLQLNHPLLQFTYITYPLLSTAVSFPDFIVIGFRPELLRWPHM